MLSSKIIKKYKESMCPYCIHSNDEDYQECNIVLQINGQADCVNYKCNEYCRKWQKNERDNSTR